MGTASPVAVAWQFLITILLCLFAHLLIDRFEDAGCPLPLGPRRWPSHPSSSPEVNERQGVFHRRTFLMGGFAGSAWRRWAAAWPTCSSSRRSATRSSRPSNQFNFRLVPPPRGVIVDRNGGSSGLQPPELPACWSRDEDDSDVAGHAEDSGQLRARWTTRSSRAWSRTSSARPSACPVSVMEDMSWKSSRPSTSARPNCGASPPTWARCGSTPTAGPSPTSSATSPRSTSRDLERRPGRTPSPCLLHPGFRIGAPGRREGLRPANCAASRRASKVEVDASRPRGPAGPEAGDIPAVARQGRRS